MPQFIHTSDLHIGAPIDTAGLPTDIAVQVRSNALKTLASICDYAVHRNVDAVVIAGDLFHTQRPADVLVANTFGIMRDAAPVQFIIAAGNHDPHDTCGAWNSYELPRNVHLFPDNTVRPITPPGSTITYWGCSWPTSAPIDSPLPDFQIPDAQANTYNVLVAHGSELDSQPASWKPYAPFRIPSIAPAHLNYIALGHLHYWHAAHPHNSYYAYYPGAPCPDSARALGPHYFALVAVYPDHAEVQKLQSPSIEFYRSAVTIDQTAPVPKLKQYLSGSLGSPPTKSIAHISLIGSPDAKTHNALPGIIERARPLFLHLHALDFTTPPEITRQITQADESLADFFVALDNCIENAESQEIASHFQDSKVIAMAAHTSNIFQPRNL